VGHQERLTSDEKRSGLMTSFTTDYADEVKPWLKLSEDLSSLSLDNTLSLPQVGVE